MSQTKTNPKTEETSSETTETTETTTGTTGIQLSPEFEQLLNEFYEALQQMIEGLPVRLSTATSTPQAASIILETISTVAGALHTSLQPQVTQLFQDLYAAACREDDKDVEAILRHTNEVWAPLVNNPFIQLANVWSTVGGIVSFFDRVTVEDPETEESRIILPAAFSSVDLGGPQ